MHDDTRTLSRIRGAFWLVGIALALVQVVIFRNWVNGDAISYFDMSDAVVTGQWHRLVNGAWSPLYPLLIGVADAIIRPAAAWEFPVAHLVNFVCFVFAFACFEALLRQAARSVEASSATSRHVPRWAIFTIGYALFLWGSIGILSLIKPTPDMLMSGFLYLALALVLRIQRGGGTTGAYLLLGIVLALGYLAKAIMFPLGIIILLGVIIARHDRRALARVALAAAAFLALSAPYIIAESRLEHHLTFGDAAKVVHLTYLDRVGPYGERLGHATGAFAHPPRRIFGAPAAYEFNRPVVATYPFWYDPTYWVQGVRPGFDLGMQLRTIEHGLGVYAGIMLESCGLLLAALVLAARAGWRTSARSLLTLWPLWIVPLAALGAYALVHVEERYVGAFFAVLWLALLLPLPYVFRGTRALHAIVGVVVLTLAASTAYQLHADEKTMLWTARYGDANAAVALSRLGIEPGDHVARVSRLVESGWARLDRITVIAEVARRQVPGFWEDPRATQDSVLHAFAAVGARAVVADVPPGPVPAGWQRLGSSRYAVYLEPRTRNAIAAR